MPTLRESVTAFPTKTEGMKGAQLVETLFDNFVYYGREVAKWKYSSSGMYEEEAKYISSDDIVNGTNRGLVFCQPLAGAFAKIVREQFPNQRIDAAPATIGGGLISNFVTKSGYRSIDRSCVGNVRRSFNDYAAENRCLFSEHHVYRIFQTFYDPTLCAKYADTDGPVFVYIRKPDPGRYPALENLRVSMDFKAIFKRIDEACTGFACGYIWLVDETKLAKTELEQFKKFQKEFQRRH